MGAFRAVMREIHDATKESSEGGRIITEDEARAIMKRVTTAGAEFVDASRAGSRAWDAAKKFVL